MDGVDEAAEEIRRLRRELWFHGELLAALGDDRPLQALIARLGQLVRGTAVLYDDAGRIAASVGEGPVRLLWHELAHRERAFTSLDLGRYRVLASPVVMRGAGYWVAVVSRDAAIVEEDGEPLLLTAQGMLSAMRGARSLARTQELTRARHLVTILRGEVTADRVPQVWRRLRELRFTVNQPLRAVAATLVDPSGDTPRRRADRLETLHERAYLAGLPLVLADAPPGAPSEAGHREASVLALVGDEPALTAWLDRLATAHVVGVSEPFVDLTAAPAAYRDADMAMQVALLGRENARRAGVDGRARETGRARDGGWAREGGRAGTGREASDRRSVEEGAIVRFEDVDLARWLLSSRPPSDLAERVRRQFGPVLENADLHETLVVHLALGLDVGATARRLFLHPNTVRYRLRRIEETLGAPVSSAGVVANAYLAFLEEIVRVPPQE
ncbi:PucR family transcriptional regulator [Mobilicoccus pelagius]|uniref:Uncharacterized protein n=1 Tax=Mobilicoccus pelagius NBRC 104925 TaxID=1089455 RepID=H5UNU1_9MICO|nr:helix-turn-helix domain-containing protein [Mobilicoccus pelagius]GAB47399.1 hypothetical protein MOPEL_009_00900 [Mobilicoccus pelagius NBRC 104925]